MATQTRSKRAAAKAKHKPVAAKKTASKAKLATPKSVPTEPYKLASAPRLFARSTRLVWQHRQLFGGIILIYGILYLIFVNAASTLNVTSVRDQMHNRALGSLTAYSQLLGNSAGSTGEAAVYQWVLFVLVSLALIWALRQVYTGQKVRIRDAYYKGMYPLVPCLLVLLVIGLQLVPAIVGTSVYGTVAQVSRAVPAAQLIIWAIVAVALVLFSAYLITASVFAFYIAALPDMEPLQALRMARKLVRGRRWTGLRKILFLPLALLIITAVVLLPVILLLPLVASLVLVMLGPILMALGHSYLYALYREFMHE